MIIRPFRAVTIDTEGNAEAVEWDTNDTLRPLQQAVGGYVELVSLTATLDMWVNETGLIDGLPVNEVATWIAISHGLTHQPYFGPVVFTGGTDDQGDTLPLTEMQSAALLDFAHQVHAGL